MTVIDKHRIIKESWTFGVCENCLQNPRQSSENIKKIKKISMVKEQLVSGDPSGKYKSDSKVWICPKCGYARKL